VRKAVLFINLHQPIDQQIQEVNIFSGDPRLSFLEKLYATSNIYQWYVPVLVIEQPEIKQMFQSYIEGTGKKMYIHSAFADEHYVILVRRILPQYF
jgi:hypothetical protein